jgi:hypothetical protein
MKKTGGRKSRDTVSLKEILLCSGGEATWLGSVLLITDLSALYIRNRKPGFILIYCKPNAFKIIVLNTSCLNLQDLDSPLKDQRNVAIP